MRFDIGTDDQGLNRVGDHGGNLNDIAALQHVGDERRAAAGADASLAAEHGLDDHWRGADVDHVDLEAMFLEVSGVLGDPPGPTGDADGRIGKGNFSCRCSRRNEKGRIAAEDSKNYFLFLVHEVTLLLF